MDSLLIAQPFLESIMLNEQINQRKFDELSVQNQLFTLKLAEILSQRISSIQAIQQLNIKEDKYKEVQLSHTQLNALHDVALHLDKVSVYEGAAIPDLVKKFNTAFINGTKQQLENKITKFENPSQQDAVEQQEPKSEQSAVNNMTIQITQQYKQHFNEHEIDNFQDTNSIQVQKELLQKTLKKKKDDQGQKDLHFNFQDKTLLFNCADSQNIHKYLIHSQCNPTQLLENTEKMLKLKDKEVYFDRAQHINNIAENMKYIYFNKDTIGKAIKVMIEQSYYGNILLQLDQYYTHIPILQNLYPQQKWDSCLRNSLIKLMQHGVYDVQPQFFCRFFELFSTEEGIGQLKKTNIKKNGENSFQYQICKYLSGQLPDNLALDQDILYQIKSNGNIILLSQYLVKQCDIYHGYGDWNVPDKISQFPSNEQPEVNTIQIKCQLDQKGKNKEVIINQLKNTQSTNLNIQSNINTNGEQINYLHTISVTKHNIPFIAAIQYLKYDTTQICYIIYNPENIYAFNKADKQDKNLQDKIAYLSFTPEGTLNIATNLNSLFSDIYLPIEKQNNQLYSIDLKHINQFYMLKSNDLSEQIEHIYLNELSYHLIVDTSMKISTDVQQLHFDYPYGILSINMNNIRYKQTVPKEQLNVSKFEVTIILANGVQRKRFINYEKNNPVIQISSILQPIDNPLQIINVQVAYEFETFINGKKVKNSGNQKQDFQQSHLHPQRQIHIVNSLEDTNLKISSLRYANCIVIIFIYKNKPLLNHPFNYLVIESKDVSKKISESKYFNGQTNELGQFMINLDNANIDRLLLVKTRTDNSKPFLTVITIPGPTRKVNRLLKTYAISPITKRVVFFSREKLKEVNVNGIPRGLTKLAQYVYGFQVEANMFSNKISDVKDLDPLNLNQHLQNAIIVGVTAGNVQFELFTLALVPVGLQGTQSGDFIIPGVFRVDNGQSSQRIEILVPKLFKIEASVSQSSNEIAYEDWEDGFQAVPALEGLKSRQEEGLLFSGQNPGEAYLRAVNDNLGELGAFQCVPAPSVALKERRAAAPPILPGEARGAEQMRLQRGKRGGEGAQGLCRAENDAADGAAESCLFSCADFAPAACFAAAPMHPAAACNFAAPGIRRRLHGAGPPGAAAAGTFAQTDLRSAKLLMNEAEIQGDDFSRAPVVNKAAPLPYSLKQAEVKLTKSETAEFYDIYNVEINGKADCINCGFSEVKITAHGDFYVKKITIPLFLQNLEALKPTQVEKTENNATVQKYIKLGFKSENTLQYNEITANTLYYIAEYLNISTDSINQLLKELNDDNCDIQAKLYGLSHDQLLELLLYLQLVDKKRFELFTCYIILSESEEQQVTAQLLLENKNMQTYYQNLLSMNEYQQLLLYKLNPTIVIKNLLLLKNNKTIIDIVNQQLTENPQNLISLLLMIQFGLGMSEEQTQTVEQEIKGKFSFQADNNEYSEPRGNKLNFIHFIPEQDVLQDAQFVYSIKQGGQLIHEFKNFCSARIHPSGTFEITVQIHCNSKQTYVCSQKFEIWKHILKSPLQLLKQQLQEAKNSNNLQEINVRELVNYKISRYEFATAIFEFYDVKNAKDQEKLMEIIDYQINKLFSINFYLLCPVIMHMHDQYNYDIAQNFSKYNKQEQMQIAFFLRAQHLSQVIQEENVKEDELKIKNQEVIKVDNSQFEKIDIYQYLKQYIIHVYDKQFFNVSALTYVYPGIQQRSLVQQLYQLTKDQQLKGLDRVTQGKERVNTRYQIQFLHSLIHQDYENLFVASIYAQQYKIALKCLNLSQQKLNSKRFQLLTKYFQNNYVCVDNNNFSFNSHTTESLSRYGKVLKRSQERNTQGATKNNLFSGTNKLYLFNQDIQTLLVNLSYKNYTQNSNIQLFSLQSMLTGKSLQLNKQIQDGMLMFQLNSQQKIFLRIDTDMYEIDTPTKSSYKLLEHRMRPSVYKIVDKNNNALAGAKIQLKDCNRKTVKYLVTDILGYFSVYGCNAKYIYLENGEYVEIQ